MAKAKGKRVMYKLIGSKQTSVWVSKEQQEMAKKLGVTNQAFVQGVFDVAIGFVIRVDLNSDYSKVIDSSGKAMTSADYKHLAEILAQEIVTNLQTERAEQ